MKRKEKEKTLSVNKQIGCDLIYSMFQMVSTMDIEKQTTHKHSIFHMTLFFIINYV